VATVVGPATGHLDTGFFFPNTEVVPKFEVATACFSCSPPDLNSPKLSPITVKTTKIMFLNYNNNLELKSSVLTTITANTKYPT
jgi:hypothetical protein